MYGDSRYKFIQVYWLYKNNVYSTHTLIKKIIIVWMPCYKRLYLVCITHTGNGRVCLCNADPDSQKHISHDAVRSHWGSSGSWGYQAYR